MQVVASVLFYHILFGVLHELGHILAGALLGCCPASNWIIGCFSRRVFIPAAGHGWREPIVRHAGWIGSILTMGVVVQADLGVVAICMAALTVVEALASDMFLLSPSGKHSGWFFCGNFGMILIDAAWTKGSQAMDILEKMVQITMMRGAQSGGVVTYVQSGRSRCEDLRGLRARVINSKRGDLSKSVPSKLRRVERWARITNGHTSGVRLYAGHTRFATSSKATFAGTHPHQWSPPCTLRVFVGFDSDKLTQETRNYENFVSHNGDFDFFDISGRTYALESILSWLVRATGHAMPTCVDSCAIAGLIDLLRTQGDWFLSVRFGFLFGSGHKRLDYDMPERSSFESVAKRCEDVFVKYLHESDYSLGKLALLQERIAEDILQLPKATPSEALGLSPYHFAACISKAVDAFFSNDLLQAVQIFLDGAKGSFGLCVTSSLDANSKMVLAARGQTMSVAFYPEVGLILYGSEQASVKAAVGVTPLGWPSERPTKVSPCDLGPPVRIDLDDSIGELCLLDWGQNKDAKLAGHIAHSMMGGAVNMTLVHDTTPTDVARVEKAVVRLSGMLPDKPGDLSKRLVPLEGNSFVLPLPAEVKDPVACDLADIPRVLSNIQNDWNNGGSNRLVAWNLGRQLKTRLLKKKQGLIERDAIDILVTGCEVNLWLAEQFAADLTLAFKRLKVSTISANKVLGLMGQKVKMPQLGHQISEGELDLSDSIVLIVSHSGGTFSSLNVSKLLQSVSQNLFVITSELDTQLGKQVRSINHGGPFVARVFTTNIGVRPAEPCSISVAATQQLLTQIFEYIAIVISGSIALREAAGSILEDSDLHQLSRCNQDNIYALQDIIGIDISGEPSRKNAVSKELRKKGAYWAQHVLETPRAWILCTIYVLVTVILGKPLVTGLCQAGGLEEDSPKLYITRTVDAAIYVFLPQLFILLIRLVQGRTLLHRMVARAVVIGDCPWVAQCVEAFLSKLFACSYSAAGIHVFSGNPADHLVHRMTHRVVRGSLLAVGRPDGRLSALSSLEQSVCLSVNQASSIQSIGSTCESLTIGHNPYPLPLCQHSIFLARHRPEFLCERLLRETRREESYSQIPTREPTDEIFADIVGGKRDEGTGEEDLPELLRMSSGALLGEYSTIFEEPATPKSPLEHLKNVRLERARITEARRSRTLLPPDVIDELSADSRPVAEPSRESYFGEQLRDICSLGNPNKTLLESQELLMQLYESRIASLQRALAFFVLFHEMGKQVAEFWPRVSFGLLGYRVDRSHSIMRVATTASPVSGADVRAMMTHLSYKKAWSNMNSAMSFLQKQWRVRAHAKRLLGLPLPATMKSSKKDLDLSLPILPRKLILDESSARERTHFNVEVEATEMLATI